VPARLFAVALAAAVLHVVLLIGDAAPGLALVSKPVPALALAAAVLWPGGSTPARLVGAGLLASAAGDLLLEWPTLFLPGLIAFLLAHVAYASAFVARERRPRLARALPFVVWLSAMGAWLRPGLGAMKVPVLVYMVAIGAMMWRAAALAGGEHRGGWRALSGAVLFGASDSLIAAHRFRAPIEGVDVPIMVLYYAGQVLIAASAGTAGPGSRS
jgi:uncharacterized membrane protein YhhN